MLKRRNIEKHKPLLTLQIKNLQTQYKRYFIKSLYFILSFLLFSNSFVYAQRFDFDVFAAIFKGDIDYVEGFLANGGDINSSGATEDTLLVQSIFFGQTQIAMMLIERGADINKPETLGQTPLYWAIRKRNQTVTQALIERNAALDPNSDSSKDFLPINLADIVPSYCISDSPQTWIDANTHPEFLPYIEEYLSVKKEIIGQEELDYPIKILFYRSDSEAWRQVSRLADNFNFQGIAFSKPHTKHILINYDAWISLSETKRELIIFHELGHCDLNRRHTTSIEPTSIMNVFYTQRLFVQGVDISNNTTLQQDLYQELFSARGNLEENYIEGQAYPIDLLSDNPQVCPAPTRLYLNESEANESL